MTCQHRFKKGKRGGQYCLNYVSSQENGQSGYCTEHLKAFKHREQAPQRAKSDLTKFITTNYRPRDNSALLADSSAGRIDSGIKRSDFALTINLNKTVAGLSDEQSHMFKLLSEYLFDCGGIEDFIVDLKDGVTTILNQFVEHNFEVGEKFGKLHVHSLIHLKHDGKVRLDIPRLRDFIDDAMGYKVHINVQAIKGGGTVGDWLKYMRKNQKESK